MRYIMSMAGAAGFAFVVGFGLWRGNSPATVLLGALFAAVGFGLFARLWMELVLQGLEDSLLTKQMSAKSGPGKSGEKFLPVDAPESAPNEQ
ncbi:MAG: hypothetical protein QGG55_12250 [Verrucomicrobiota bacterium]|jgi:hypothetical protein|nr:hypothetical protein [Verrucomicrobiota bacterium]